MTAATIRVDDTAAHESDMANHRGISLNEPMEQFSTTSLQVFDTESRFRLRAAKSSPSRGLAILDKLDAALTKGSAKQKRPGRWSTPWERMARSKIGGERSHPPRSLAGPQSFTRLGFLATISGSVTPCGVS